MKVFVKRTHFEIDVKPKDMVGHAGTLDPMATGLLIFRLFPLFTKFFPQEPETEICASMLDAINECVQGKDRTSEEKRIAICVFDDVAEHCGDATFKYYETFQLCWKHEMIQAQTSPRLLFIGVVLWAEFGGVYNYTPCLSDNKDHASQEHKKVLCMVIVQSTCPYFHLDMWHPKRRSRIKTVAGGESKTTKKKDKSSKDTKEQHVTNRPMSGAHHRKLLDQ
ncbi:armadillo-type fold protein [Artemisia annua]|uniref:Armadillo-type fold protein n=1 Tax=Artemisia annua TaxID=35608 RepID=A0A2U1MSU3_ARTAN|nr:armadillo-type fold protein [Artemisia annua]